MTSFENTDPGSAFAVQLPKRAAFARAYLFAGAMHSVVSAALWSAGEREHAQVQREARTGK